MVDVKKLWGIFVEEANEKLTDLEDGLLALEKSPDDSELINRLFRAAHTIKGSSASLGFPEISKFTHGMEEILDSMRQGSLKADKAVTDVLLGATDAIKAMVASIFGCEEFDYGGTVALSGRMKAIAGGDCAPAPQPEAAVSAVSKTWRVAFEPNPGMLLRGLDPLMLFDDLAAISESITLQCDTDAVPQLSAIDPEALYLKWDVRLATAGDKEDISRVFDFAEQGSKLLIQESRLLEPDTIGGMLVAENIVSPTDVEDALKSQKRLGDILVEQGKAAREDVERVVDKQRSGRSESFKNTISSTIRVDLGKLDHLINLVGEMVIIHSMFFQTLHGDGHGGNGHNGNGQSAAGAERFEGILQQLQRIGRDIQESTMSLRMLPIGEVFGRFGRLVRELSSTKGKEIDLVLEGEETEMDKGMLEKITDPLVHLIRNSIDHGIETPQERASAGKPAKGTLRLSAYQHGDAVYIDVEDDGRGLNRERILAKGIQNGLVKADAALADDQIYGLIFAPGFSTAEKVTDVSGRGVGMDVVKRSIDELNGKVQLVTEPGRGTKITIKLPLTLAIIDGLTVSIGDERFIIPITSVIESLRPRQTDVNTVEGRGEVVNVRGEYLRMIRLHELLGVDPMCRNPWEAIVVVARHDGHHYCLLVDALLGQQQVVIKHLGRALPKVSDIAGGTILGDGRVALVLDVPGIVDIATRN